MKTYCQIWNNKMIFVRIERFSHCFSWRFDFVADAYSSERIQRRRRVEMGDQRRFLRYLSHGVRCLLFRMPLSRWSMSRSSWRMSALLPRTLHYEMDQFSTGEQVMPDVSTGMEESAMITNIYSTVKLLWWWKCKIDKIYMYKRQFSCCCFWSWDL